MIENRKIFCTKYEKKMRVTECEECTIKERHRGISYKNCHFNEKFLIRLFNSLKAF